MFCVVQNSPVNRMFWCNLLTRIKYVTCQFYLPVSKYRFYHYKHFSNVTWPDYLKSTAYLLNQNSAFVIMLKRQISSWNIRKLLFNTITIRYIYIYIYIHNCIWERYESTSRSLSYPLQSTKQNVETYTASVSVRIHFVCNRKLRHSHSIASRKGPRTRQLFSEYRRVSALHSVSKQY